MPPDPTLNDNQPLFSFCCAIPRQFANDLILLTNRAEADCRHFAWLNLEAKQKKLAQRWGNVSGSLPFPSFPVFFSHNLLALLVFHQGTST